MVVTLTRQADFQWAEQVRDEEEGIPERRGMCLEDRSVGLGVPASTWGGGGSTE